MSICFKDMFSYLGKCSVHMLHAILCPQCTWLCFKLTEQTQQHLAIHVAQRARHICVRVMMCYHFADWRTKTLTTWVGLTKPWAKVYYCDSQAEPGRDTVTRGEWRQERERERKGGIDFPSIGYWFPGCLQKRLTEPGAGDRCCGPVTVCPLKSCLKRHWKTWCRG